MLCPFNCFQECHGKACAAYNPFLKGCGLLVNPLALGEELANCRQELRQISGHLEVLATCLQPLECVPEVTGEICASLGALASTMDSALEECGGPAAVAENTAEEVKA